MRNILNAGDRESRERGSFYSYFVFMQMGHPLIYSLFSFSIFYSSPVECYNHETTYCTGVYAVQYIKEKKKERSES